MYTGEILRVGERHSEERVNLGRKNLGLEDQDVICVANFGYINRFDTMRSVCEQFNTQFASIEEAMAALLESLNNPEPTPDPSTESEYKEYYDTMTTAIEGGTV